MSNICLGMLLGLPHLGMAGSGDIYRPQHKSSRWRKVAALCGAPDSPVRLAVGLTPQVTVGAARFYTGQSVCHTGQSGGFSPLVPPGTSRPSAPDSPTCDTGQSIVATHVFVLDFA
jgi:hypothetical protein